MFWAAFSQISRTGLILLNGDSDSIRKGVTARVIIDLYQNQLLNILGPGDIFMQDNAPVHTARIVRNLLQEMGLIIMIWPPYSPDLNPIENLWASMKVEIYKLYPELEFANDIITILAQLVTAAKEAWYRIDERVLYNLSITMPYRMQAVIAADG